MNEIIKQRIEEAANEFDKEGLRVIFENGANFILNNLWISVDELLPPLDDGMESVSVEVVVKNEYGKATCAWYSYITNTWHLSYGEIAGDDLIDSKITHWMEIPKN